MAEITEEEWEEWRSMEQTRELKKTLREYHDNMVLGYPQVSPDARLALLDRAQGVMEAIDVVNNIHKEP